MTECAIVAHVQVVAAPLWPSLRPDKDETFLAIVGVAILGRRRVELKDKVLANLRAMGARVTAVSSSPGPAMKPAECFAPTPGRQQRGRQRERFKVHGTIVVSSRPHEHVRYSLAVMRDRYSAVILVTTTVKFSRLV